MKTQVKNIKARHPSFRRIILPGMKTGKEAPGHFMKQQKVACPTRDGYRFVSIDEIRYCQAESNYTRLCLSDETTVLISRTLSDVEEILPEAAFIRIHQSYLVHMESVTHYASDHVLITGKRKLPVSRSRRKQVREVLLGSMLTI